MQIYLLELTDEGRRRAPAYEVVGALVVVALNCDDARDIAAEAALDEGPCTWLDPQLSSIKLVGLSMTLGSAGVMCREDNAS